MRIASLKKNTHPHSTSSHVTKVLFPFKNYTVAVRPLIESGMDIMALVTPGSSYLPTFYTRRYQSDGHTNPYISRHPRLSSYFRRFWNVSPDITVMCCTLVEVGTPDSMQVRDATRRAPCVRMNTECSCAPY
jgi:hypothetical protein